jgi:predicted phage-related endonuclease
MGAKMIIHNIVQGSDAWHEFRFNHHGASEAAAMLNLSKTVQRNELLRLKKTGTKKEFSDYVQKFILDYGHKVEALARPIIEKQIGEELYPVTVSDGYLSCSCDGISMKGEVVWEHKQFSQSLFTSISNGELPEDHWPQCQQVLMITGAKKLIFTVSDGTEENMVSMDVYPDQEKFNKIIAGWAQFDKDVVEYVPVEFSEKPLADTIESLPMAHIQASGEIVSSNLSLIVPRFDLFLSSQKTTLLTDEDFVNGEEVAKFSRDVASKLKLTAKATIDQISSIGDAVRVLESYASKFDGLGLKLEKLVKSEKDDRKNQIIFEAKKKWSEHIDALNSELKLVSIRVDSPNFIEAVKNKRTILSLQNAVDSALAESKIVADAMAMLCRKNLSWLSSEALEFNFLYANDIQAIVQKDHEDFKNLINARISKFKDKKPDPLINTANKVIKKSKNVFQSQEDIDILAEKSPSVIDLFLSSKTWSEEKKHFAMEVIAEFINFEEGLLCNQ